MVFSSSVFGAAPDPPARLHPATARADTNERMTRHDPRRRVVMGLLVAQDHPRFLMRSPPRASRTSAIAQPAVRASWHYGCCGLLFFRKPGGAIAMTSQLLRTTFVIAIAAAGCKQ